MYEFFQFFTSGAFEGHFGSEHSRCSCGALGVYNEMKGLHDAGFVPPS